MNELVGVLAALLSSALGGTSVGATRYLVGTCDALTLGAFRFGIGFALLLPIALTGRANWPARADWPGVAGLGLLFFALFPALFNASLLFTTAARGALALSTLPVLTMLVGAALGAEALTLRKAAGVLVAMLGVAIALLSGLAAAPRGAWKGDLLMAGAALCMALYSVWSKPFVRRSAPVTFAAMGMAVGAACLIVTAGARGGFAAVQGFAAPQWLAIGYLGVFGGALTFLLWAIALGRTTPTRVAISVTVNPVTASLVGAVLLGEPIGWNLIVGMAAVFAGIWLATIAGPGTPSPHPIRRLL
jgi:drug/metabolite transporter (DMT)-like permease